MTQPVAGLAIEMHDDVPRLTGILLAAGKGTRFDPAGARSKLLQPLPDGAAVVVAAARNLLAALPDVLAVIRPDSDALALELKAVGCRITRCPNAEQGLAASLVHALAQASQAQGWVIALGDMPYVQPATMRALAAAIAQGAQIAVPTNRARRGNPVAFGRAYLPDLLRLHGDEGARHLLKTMPVVEIATDDPGIFQDIDTWADLHQNMPQEGTE